MYLIALGHTATVELDADACLLLAQACRQMGKGSPAGADGPRCEGLAALFAAAATATALHGMTMSLDAVDEAELARIHREAHGAY